MTIPTAQQAAASDNAAADDDFDLDVSIVESGPMIAELIRVTDDGCGATCESACNSCP